MELERDVKIKDGKYYISTTNIFTEDDLVSNLSDIKVTIEIGNRQIAKLNGEIEKTKLNIAQIEEQKKSFEELYNYLMEKSRIDVKRVNERLEKLVKDKLAQAQAQGRV